MLVSLFLFIACNGDKSIVDTAQEDVDGDGYAPADGDCDEADPAISPEAEEDVGDGLDANCDGLDCATEVLDGLRLFAPWEFSHAGRALSMGDLDGDSQIDLVVGAPYFEDLGHHGEVYVVKGPVVADGTLSGGTIYTGLLEEQFDGSGWAVATPGDMNGDGLGDMAYTIRQGDGLENLSGRVYVIDGPADTGNNFEAPDRSLYGSVRFGRFGSALTGAGDADGDGLADLLVGEARPAVAPDEREDYPGRVYIYTGPIGEAQTADDAWLTLVGEEDRDSTGESVASGDFNGDGHPDVLVGGRFSTPRGVDSGKAWVVYGPVSGVLTLDGADALLLGEAAGDCAGRTVANAGDTDGDGTDDLLVAALDTEDGARDGLVYLVPSPVSGSVGLETIATRYTSAGDDDYNGFALGSAGDVDSDGLADVLVAAPQLETRSTHRFARLSLYSGSQSGELDPEAASRIWVSPEYRDTAGWSFAAGADLTGDGAADLVVGSPTSNQSGEESGLIYILSL